MNGRLSIFALIAAAAWAQPSVTRPGAGLVRSVDGSVYSATGIAGNFILEDTGIPNAVSTAFSGFAGMVKTDVNLVVLDANCQTTATFDTPPGSALFAFDSTGAPALAWFASTLYRFGANGLDPVNWAGTAAAVGVENPNVARVIDRRDSGLWDVRLALDSGAVLSESQLDGVTEPVLLLPGRSILYATATDLIVRDPNAAERGITAGFQAASFERIGKDWIAVREAGPGRLFALRITPLKIDLVQIPEATP